MIKLIRDSKSFRNLRRSGFVISVLRPIWDRHLVKRWWKEGRPNPPPHALKIAAIQYLGDSINACNMVETGAYLGDTIRALQGRFETLHSIELAEIFALPLQAEFAHDPAIQVVLGDSGEKLKEVVTKLEGPTVLWLDAHYSGGDTVGDGVVPIFAEIRTIHDLCSDQHAILIDDMVDFKGGNGYPSVPELSDLLRSLGYSICVFNNMMHCTSAREKP